MKTRIGILVVLCTVLSCTSTSTNVANAGTQNREVGTFKNIQASSGINVYFTQEQSQSVRVETTNVDENEVITEVKDGTLVIKMKSSNSWGFNVKRRSVKVYVSAPELEEIDISSGSNCNIKNLRAYDCVLSASSGSNATIGALIFAELEVSASSGSNINLSGKADTVRISASSGSNVDVRNLQRNQIDSEASSGGSVRK